MSYSQEKPDFVVCMLKGEVLILPDNATGQCNDCGRGIQFRPHVLRDFPAIPRICVECAVARATGGRA